MPYNRQEEEQKMGSFELEEGVKNVMLILGDDCNFNLHEMRDFNSNMDNVIRSQQINRG